MAKKKVETKKSAEKTVKKAAPKKAAKKVVKKAAVKKVAPKKSVAKKATKKDSATTKTAKPVKITDENKLLSDAVVDGILDKKGKNVSVMDLRGIHNRVCDYFIICQADSNTQVSAIAGSVEEIVKKKTGDKPYRSEGFENSEWILIDYVTVVVHIFQSHIRSFYNLEALWADAEITKVAFD